MWFKTTSRRKQAEPERTRLFDDAFLRRLEQLSLQVQRTLRGRPAFGAHPSRRQLPAIIFSDHRPYSAGDDYRYVDWNAYAHQEEIFVKLGETDQSIAVHLLLDVSRSMDWGSPNKLRSALQLAGALGYLALSYNDRLFVQPFGATTLRPFGPTNGKGRLIDMLKFLEGLRADQPTALGDVLNNYAARFPQGGLLVVCSDMLTPETLAHSLRVLEPPRWQVLVLHVVDQREINPTPGELLELVDSETGERLPLSLDDETIALYKANLFAWQEELRTTCARHGATYAPILTNWPLERQVIPYLRLRQILA
ncbi:MAG TPA: DUF58 domain-containing protein [Roseiflexaceae bacterium]|nr:DUF58 domain-containing protein [Roseiflexaceae bacterium]